MIISPEDELLMWLSSISSTFLINLPLSLRSSGAILSKDFMFKGYRPVYDFLQSFEHYEILLF